MNRRLLALAAAALAAWPTPTRAQPDGGQDVKPPQAAVDFACNQRKPCEVIEVKSAGTGERAEPLSVFKLALGPTKRTDLMRPCEDFEYWLTDGQKTQALLHICNEGYGAHGTGWDEVKVGPNEFTHSRDGGTNWRWGRTTTVRLSPLRILRKEKRGYIGYGTPLERWEFDYEPFKGSMRWEPWPCESQDTGQAQGERPVHGYLLIPWLTLPQAYLTEGWKKAPLGSCAAWVDGEQSGFTVHGKADQGNDSSLRVVASGSTLLIEVRDDVWTPASDRWLHDDHLELWLGRTAASFMTLCPEQEALRAFQWGIRVADGKVFPAAGKPRQRLEVERARLKDASGHEVVHFKVTLPPGMRAMTVVYSDSDDGKQQERLIATSTLRFNDPMTLGRLEGFSPSEAVCELRNGALSARLTRKFTPREPVLKD